MFGVVILLILLVQIFQSPGELRRPQAFPPLTTAPQSKAPAFLRRTQLETYNKASGKDLANDPTNESRP
ncbi:hypothetical protein [Pseudarthrobacter sp. AB1]|uniref:hypothetical protein n=1 Tax=Pseudarthrobacter sp. AB1 TaxID=2138309 RepID=UPI00186B9EA0|nr:hypothetical protein [Pseudarthrobacter sp. AB1]MBE4716870.1 hypothetical protein [Pseudarthrobacter sp. AB1]